MNDAIYAARDALDLCGAELPIHIVQVAVEAAATAIFAPEQLARVSASTGLSLQTVTEVARELRSK